MNCWNHGGSSEASDPQPIQPVGSLTTCKPNHCFIQTAPSAVSMTWDLSERNLARKAALLLVLPKEIFGGQLELRRIEGNQSLESATPSAIPATAC